MWRSRTSSAARKRTSGTALSYAQLRRLTPGMQVQFSVQAPAELAGVCAEVIGVHTYMFTSGSHTAFVLALPEGGRIQCIVARHQGKAYLALSRALSLREQAQYFGEEGLSGQWAQWRQLHLRLAEEDSLTPWLASSYRRRLHEVQGCFYEGGYVEAKEKGHEQPCRYTLFVSEDEAHLLEVEHYEDRRVVCAALLRPVSDIVALIPCMEEGVAASAATAMPQQGIAASVADMDASAQTPAAREAQARSVPPAHATGMPLPPSSPLPAAASGASGAVPSARTAAASSASAPQLHTPMAVRVQHLPAVGSVIMESRAQALVAGNAIEWHKEENTSQQDKEAMLTCDAYTAQIILQESERSGLPLAYILRKILTLPTNTLDRVYIPLALSDQDYAVLAQRYGLDPTDYYAIACRALEDVRAFGGHAPAPALSEDAADESSDT